MPLTKKGSKIKRAMQKQYGKKRGESIFYGWKNKNKITGLERRKV